MLSLYNLKPLVISEPRSINNSGSFFLHLILLNASSQFVSSSVTTNTSRPHVSPNTITPGRFVTFYGPVNLLHLLYRITGIQFVTMVWTHKSSHPLLQATHTNVFSNHLNSRSQDFPLRSKCPSPPPIFS